ncbi:MAG: Ms5788A family Cys-rich leader peptide [Mycobacteriales bacterium]
MRLGNLGPVMLLTKRRAVDLCRVASCACRLS